MFRKLLMVTPDNHNKEYIMTAESPNSDFFVVNYGRVGAKYVSKKYPMVQWDKKYQEKVNKGYVDVSQYYSAKYVESDEFKAIEDPKVAKLVKSLIEKARSFVKKKYNFEIANTTDAMIKDVQQHIDKLMDEDLSVEEFNRILLKIFNIIPRKMKHVEEHLAKEKRDFARIVEEEQRILDAMAGQVYSGTVEESQSKTKDKTILDNSNLSIRPCTPKEEKQIKKYLTPESACLFKQAFRVVNERTEKRFHEYCENNEIGSDDIHFYYHGSLSENFWNIITLGLTINPVAKTAGKMFGFGTYFATRAKKSIRYTDLGNIHRLNADTGFLAVYKVAYKKPWDIYKWKPEHTHLRYENVKKKGYDAVFAHKGESLVNNEIIVYQDCQSTIQYLIELHEEPFRIKI